MEPTGHENWRSESGTTPSLQHPRKFDSPNENWTERGNGRRMSDGAPVPLNRTRSFKTKQLVRSQAIRESQSPPRVPSPRPPGKVEMTDRNKMSSVKKKSLSVDSDDRNTSEEFKMDLCAEKTPIILKKTDLPKTSDNSNSNYSATTQSTGDSSAGDSDSSAVKTLSGALNNNTSKRNNINIDTKKHNETGIKNKDHCDTSNSKAETSKSISNNKNSNITSSIETQATLGRTTPSQYTMHKTNSNCNVAKPALERFPNELNRKEPTKVNLTETKKQNSFNKTQNNEEGNTDRKILSPVNRSNNGKVEFQQVEIQVTSGDYDTNTSFPTNLHDKDNIMNSLKANRRCDCMSLDEFQETERNADTSNWKGRRATCPSKQDSGICCWEQCQCCGDLSPDSNASIDAEDDSLRYRKHKQNIMDHDVHHQSIDNCRCQERLDRWPHRTSGSTLTVQRASSGGNPRLLRKQSSGGSIDSGQHSIASPFLSRDNSTELVTGNYESIDLARFVKETLNKSYKDRMNLLKIEQELVSLVKDPHRYEHRFPQSSSYGRLLIHRCAELFGMKHGVDASKQFVYVAKSQTGKPQCRIPPICPFEQWCVEKFLTSPTTFCVDYSLPAKSILKRDTHSLDEEGATLQASRPTLRSKSFEQREEEYSKARQRIFNSTGQEEHWDWEEKKGNESDMEHCRPQLILPENDRTSRSARLTKVHSLENQKTIRVVRGVVSKAHSFGGYGDRPNVIRQDSSISTHSAPPTRILSHKGELASSNWRLSPGNSSGYRTLSARSDSITPSPTPNNGDSVPPNGGVLWAITDMSSVPPGAVIIHPQTGQPLINSDGSVYHYDPAHPPNTTLLNTSHMSAEGIHVLTNPERRRSRLEKQRATLSPGNEADLLNDKLAKSTENIQQMFPNTPSNIVDQQSKQNVSEEVKYSNINSNEENGNNAHVCLCPECENININTNQGETVTPTDNANCTTNNAENNDEEIEENVYYVSGPDTNTENNTTEKKQNNDTNVVMSCQVSETSIGIEANKMLEQVVAAEYYMPSENYIYGSGYENVPEISTDPNLLDQTLQLETSIGIQSCDTPIIHKEVKQEYTEELNRDVMITRRQESGYSAMLNPYTTVEAQGYYDTGIHQLGSYPNAVTYEDYNSEVQPYTGCCAPMLVRGPPAGVYPPQPYALPLPLPPPYVSAPPPAMLAPPTSTHPPPPPPPSQPHMYQGWGWPTMLYTPHTSLPLTTVGELPKVATHGTYITQAGDGSAQANSNVVTQGYYPHGQTATTMLVTQPPPCFPYPQQSSSLIPMSHTQQPIYHTYPIYQYPVPGRSSVLSHEGSTTPGFHTYDNQNTALTNTSQQQFTKTQEDVQRMRNNNSKSPKNVLSREQSHSGSSRATPLMNIQPVVISGVPMEGYSPMEQSLMNPTPYAPNSINYGIQQYKYSEPANASRNNIDTNNRYTKSYISENKSSATYNEKNSPNEKIAGKTNDLCNNQVEKCIESSHKISHAKSLDSYSNNNEKIVDKRNAFRNSTSVNTISRQNSFDHGNCKAIIDKTIPPPSTLDSHLSKLNARLNTTQKTSEPQNVLTVSDTDNNKYSIAISPAKDTVEHCKDANDDSLVATKETKQSVQDTSNATEELSNMAKLKSVLQEVEKAEMSKQNIRENVIKNYVNFPKARQGNYYKQNYYRNYERDDREPRRCYNRDQTSHNVTNVQGSTSAWILRNSEGPQYSKNSTTSTYSTAPSSVYTTTKPYGEKSTNYQQATFTKYYNKNPKKDHTKEQYTAPNSATATSTTSQDIIHNVQQQLSNAANTNNAFNKSMQRSNRTPPVVNNYNQGNTNATGDPCNVIRTQLIQTLGGVSLLQTPPQSTFYLRQIPGWLRRPPGPSLFGSPPPMAPHIRAPRPPRPFTQHTHYRQR